MGPQLRGGAQPGLGHPVRALAAQDEPSLAGAVLVAEYPVWIELDGQSVGEPGQLVGTQQPGMLGEKRFGLLPLRRRDVQRQVGQEALDDAHVFAVEIAGSPGLRRGRLVRRQRFTGEGGALGQGSATRARRRASAGLMRSQSASTLAGAPRLRRRRDGSRAD